MCNTNILCMSESKYMYNKKITKLLDYFSPPFSSSSSFAYFLHLLQKDSECTNTGRPAFLCYAILCLSIFQQCLIDCIGGFALLCLESLKPSVEP